MSERIIQSAKEGLLNQAFRIQRLKEEGINTGSMLEETMNKINRLSEIEGTNKMGQPKPSPESQPAHE